MTAFSGEFRREVAALREVFGFLAQFFDEHEIDEKTAFSVNLVVEELFTNMVRHNEGGGQSIALGLERRDDHVFLELIDTDVEPFDPDTAEVPPVDAGIEERRPGGLGIYLVRKMVDELKYEYESEGRRMRITAIKALEN
jgi:serine/threonine-protein kinase RsbW